jgi:predicted DCC family thiol-disulfide oxidoreductase YuxK
MVSLPATQAAEPPPALTVLFDGGCPLCRREIGHYRNVQPNIPVCFADVNDPATPLPSGIPREQLAQDASAMLVARSEVLRALMGEGKLKIVAAMHDIGTGKITRS